jgi:hypothetical protein
MYISTLMEYFMVSLLGAYYSHKYLAVCAIKLKRTAHTGILVGELKSSTPLIQKPTI